MNTITLKRYNGNEIYESGPATLRFINNGEEKALIIKVTTIKPIETIEDTKSLKAKPILDITIPLPKNSILLDNYHFNLCQEYDENNASLYYIEHQVLTTNIINIKKTGDTTYAIRWQAKTCDVNNYDGSKPETEIEAVTEALLK